MGGSQAGFVRYCQPVSEKKEGETPIFRSVQSPNKLIDCPQENIKTMQDVFLNSVKNYKNCNLFGRKNANGVYEWETYDQVFNKAKALGAAIIENNLFTNVQEYKNFNLNLIGIFSKNRPEWLLLEYSNFLYKFTLVPFYDTLGPESISFILEQTNLQTIFCTDQSLKVLLNCKSFNKLQNIVMIDKISVEYENKIKENNWKLFLITDLIKQGQSLNKEFAKITQDDVFTFSYTSGTTGTPKGALITHRNMVSIIAISLSENFNKNDVYISYLPLPHVLERIFISCVLYAGAAIGFYSGDVLKLKDDLQALKPTLFVSVPRLYNKFFDAIKQGIEKQSGFKKWLINAGLNKKLSNYEQDCKTTSFFYDALVFNKMKQALGGRCRFAATGGAPISVEVLKFLKVALCVQIQEGYGQTESTGASFATSAFDKSLGHVGGCRSNIEYKLVDVPEMQYTSLDKNDKGQLAPRGEICLRGHAIFAGYYKDEDKTKEAIDADGWLHTGDIGRINFETGALTVIDRKKNIFKLQQGEYIAPEKIENIYLRAQGVEEVFVYGDSLKNDLVAIVVPKKPFVENFAKEKQIAQEFNDICNNQELNKIILGHMNDLGKKEGLNGFEQAKAIHLEPQSFLILDCMTNTFKIKRREASQRYKQIIEQLYNDLAKKQKN